MCSPTQIALLVHSEDHTSTSKPGGQPQSAGRGGWVRSLSTPSVPPQLHPWSRSWFLTREIPAGLRLTKAHQRKGTGANQRSSHKQGGDTLRRQKSHGKDAQAGRSRAGARNREAIGSSGSCSLSPPLLLGLHVLPAAQLSVRLLHCLCGLPLSAYSGLFWSSILLACM